MLHDGPGRPPSIDRVAYCSGGPATLVALQACAFVALLPNRRFVDQVQTVVNARRPEGKGTETSTAWPKTGASSTHSKRFAHFGCGFGAPCLCIGVAAAFRINPVPSLKALAVISPRNRVQKRSPEPLRGFCEETNFCGLLAPTEDQQRRNAEAGQSHRGRFRNKSAVHDEGFEVIRVRSSGELPDYSPRTRSGAQSRAQDDRGRAEVVTSDASAGSSLGSRPISAERAAPTCHLKVHIGLIP